MLSCVKWNGCLKLMIVIDNLNIWNTCHYTQKLHSKNPKNPLFLLHPINWNKVRTNPQTPMQCNDIKYLIYYIKTRIFFVCFSSGLDWHKTFCPSGLLNYGRYLKIVPNWMKIKKNWRFDKLKSMAFPYNSSSPSFLNHYIIALADFSESQSCRRHFPLFLQIPRREIGKKYTFHINTHETTIWPL